MSCISISSHYLRVNKIGIFLYLVVSNARYPPHAIKKLRLSAYVFNIYVINDSFGLIDEETHPTICSFLSLSLFFSFLHQFLRLHLLPRRALSSAQPTREEIK